MIIPIMGQVFISSFFFFKNSIFEVSQGKTCDVTRIHIHIHLSRGKKKKLVCLGLIHLGLAGLRTPSGVPPDHITFSLSPRLVLNTFFLYIYCINMDDYLVSNYVGWSNKQKIFYP